MTTRARYYLDDFDAAVADGMIDNRDETTTEIDIPAGPTIIITKEFCERLIANMKENADG